MTQNKSDEGTFLASRLVVSFDHVKRRTNLGYPDPILFVKCRYINPSADERSWLEAPGLGDARERDFEPEFPRDRKKRPTTSSKGKKSDEHKTPTTSESKAGSFKRDNSYKSGDPEKSPLLHKSSDGRNSGAKRAYTAGKPPLD